MKIETLDWLWDKFSVSKASTFDKCPQKAQFRYVQKIKKPAELSLAALLRGRAVHGGQEADCYAKLRGERLSVGQVLDAAVATFEDEAKKEDVPAAKVGKDRFVEEHRRQLEIFEASGERAKIEPLPGSIEAPFEMEVLVTGEDRPAVIEGHVDVVSIRDGDRTVVDYKATGRAVTARESAEHTQLAMEAIGSTSRYHQIVNFVAGKRQRPTTKVLPAVALTQQSVDRVLRWFADVIARFRKALRTGDFPRCAPESQWCCPQACEYYGDCYGQVENAGKYLTIQKLSPVGTLPAAEWRESIQGKQERERKEAV